MNIRSTYVVLSALLLGFISQHGLAQPPKYKDTGLAKDFELIQGSWELLHGDMGDGPTIRSVKTITGNRSTLKRYRIDSGEQFHEHTSEFQLSKSGEVRVFTFYRVGGTPERGGSYVYRVDQKSFWDVPGLLQGGKYRNYRRDPIVYHWKRITSKKDSSESRR